MTIFTKTTEWRHKYRGYWVKIKELENYHVTIWIVGHKEYLTDLGSHCSRSYCEAVAEHYIDKILSVGGVLS